ncbi:MAG: PilZ domain-containing protein [Candidatus Omnitrophica bacterium]|nr:PilZ domain-containing protein [Candidatus Omnitrophota bacterium]
MLWKGMDRRRFPRANFPCLIRILQQGKGVAPILTHTEDISIGGVGVCIPDELELFEAIMIELDLIDGETPVSCHGKVMWVVQHKSSESTKKPFFDTGIEFITMDEGCRARLEKVVNYVTTGQKIAEERTRPNGQS